MRAYKQGFTIIELMVTLAVLAIVLGVALPSFNSQILNNRSVALGEDFATTLNFIRSEAVKRRARVSVCASSDGATCGNDWTEGFIAFVDHATSDVVNPVLVDDDGATTILRVWPAQDSRAVITVKRGAGDINFIRYTGMGTLARISNDPIILEVGLQGCTSDSARRLTIGLAGLVNMANAACL